MLSSPRDLVAIPPSADRVRFVGSVPCAAVVDLLLWRSRVAVRCAAERGTQRVLGFDDPQSGAAPAAAANAQPAAPPPSASIPKLHRLEDALPVHTDSHGIAAGPNGSLAVALNRPFGPSDAIARVAPSGAVTVVPLPVSAERYERVAPYAVAVDRSGAIWFDDAHHATL